jgi:hypothetical protein
MFNKILKSEIYVHGSKTVKYHSIYVLGSDLVVADG